MPQSIYPEKAVQVTSEQIQAQVTLEEILEAGERIAKQLAIITGLDLEKGDK